MPQQTICILLYPGCQSLDVSGPYEVFAGANAYLAAKGKPAPYRLKIAGWRGEVLRTESGLRLLADVDIERQRGLVDTLVVPGGLDHDQARHYPALVPVIRRLSARSRRIVGVCTGAFLLAEAGLLDGRRATTHWAACKALARRYPKVTVDPDPIYVRDENVYTSAGVTAGIDLSLALVEADLGREVALAIARWLVLFLRRPANQKQFSTQLQGQVAERDALRRVQDHISDHLEADLSVESLAALASMSARNFARRFKTEIGLTPAQYVTNVRLEAARRLLEDSSQSVETIATSCGFGTPETLRRTLLRKVGAVPREYRHRFQTALPASDIIPPKTMRLH